MKNQNEQSWPVFVCRRRGQDMDGVTPFSCAENLFAPVVLNELKDVAQMGYFLRSESFLLFT